MDIHWPSGVITVYKTDPFMSWTGGVVYNMDTEGFRRALKDLEDDPVGMSFPDTHRHNTTVLLGGIEYARIIEILPPYTITFSDAGGGWVCNLIGSNNNILDRANLTSVQVRSNNSAGLVQTAEIQHGIFGGGVTIDVANGVSGTLYPAGTPLQPVNNVTDARTIAAFRGFKTIFVRGDLILDSGDDVSDMMLIGENASRTFIMINSPSDTASLEIREAVVTGTLDGGTIIRDSYVFDLNYVNGFLFQCELAGTIRLGGGFPAHIMNCYAEVNYTTIDMGGSGNALNMQQCSGDFKVTNKHGSDQCGIHITSGRITLDSSVTNTTGMHIAGVGAVSNLSGQSLTHDNMISVDAIFTRAQTTPIQADIRAWNGTDSAVYAEMLAEAWARLGLDPGRPLVSGQTSITFGDIVMAMTGDATQTTLTRQ